MPSTRWMRTALASKAQNISTQDGASAAITAPPADAINTVSDQRALLGAMQNRLEHKISNLNVSSENLSAAESRIRDVDIAQEMTNYTKNNILSQPRPPCWRRQTRPAKCTLLAEITSNKRAVSLTG